MKYNLIFEMQIVDYNDPYNNVVRDIKYSPKITTKFEHTISIDKEPTKELINKIIKTMLSNKDNKFEIVSYKYLRTEININD